MKSMPPLKRLVRVGELLQQRLREIDRSPEQLAEAVDVPVEYVNELIAGRRRPPLPGRTDVYEKMTRFLRLGRNDLAACAKAERNAAAAGPGPNAGIRRLLLESCEPTTAQELERRARRVDAEVAAVFERLLSVAQGTVRRMLDDQIALRISATQNGMPYRAMRLRLLEFLDASPSTLTADDFADFMQPRIAQWDVELETGVLRVVLKTQEPPAQGRRRPAVRSRLAG
ncbi:MAG: hypothetical protein HY337_03985 [Gemmatimonadetes bacterium]|nr:hypothetical protein [Gemmatimonadota bacterium]